MIKWTVKDVLDSARQLRSPFGNQQAQPTALQQAGQILKQKIAGTNQPKVG